MQNSNTQSVETPQQKAFALFSEMPLTPYVKERLAAAQFSVPTPVQGAAIPRILEGKDVLATAQTGTGKTLAFLIPVIEDLLKNDTPGIAALVLVPTRELAMQVLEQFNVLRGKKLTPAALVVGGMAEHSQLQAIRRGARLVVATPGRLEDYLDRRLVQFNNLRTLVLDEADRMLDMGFLPSIRRIVSILPKAHQTVCFSATMEASVAHLVKDYLKSPVRLTFGSTLKPSENVRLQAFEVPADRKIEMLKKLLAKESGRVLVFCRTKRMTQRIAAHLNDDEFASAEIHGDRSQSQRNSALAGFQQGRFQILVATDVAARGIHVQDVVHVINYELPDVAENFIHRVGRTGRADKKGVASTLITRDQRGELFQMEKTLGLKMERVPAELSEFPEPRKAPKPQTHQATQHTTQHPPQRDGHSAGRGTTQGHSHGPRHRSDRSHGSNSRFGKRHFREDRGPRNSSSYDAQFSAAPSGARVVLPGEVLQARADS
jgi:ATP-dependent RNA helicase RhlE